MESTMRFTCGLKMESMMGMCMRMSMMCRAYLCTVLSDAAC